MPDPVPVEPAVVSEPDESPESVVLSDAFGLFGGVSDINRMTSPSSVRASTSGSACQFDIGKPTPLLYPKSRGFQGSMRVICACENEPENPSRVESSAPLVLYRECTCWVN